MGVYNYCFWCTLLCVHSSFAVVLMWKRELVALLGLSSWCLVVVVWLFLAVPWVCLHFVNVVFPDQTHLLFLYVIENGTLTILRYRNGILDQFVRPYADAFGPKLFWWTIMPVPTVHTSLTPIWNVRQSFVRTGLLDRRTWIRLNMHVTFILQRGISARLVQPRTIQELKDALVAAWRLIQQNRIQTLITSMRGRCRAVTDAPGRHTRYMY